MTENMAIAGNAVEALKKRLSNSRTRAIGDNRAKILDAVAAAREVDADDDVISKIKDGQIRPFARRVKHKISTTTSVDIATGGIKPYPFDSAGTQQSQQTKDDGILVIENIVMEFPSDYLLNSIRAFRNNYGVRITYAGGLKPRVVPLADVMNSEGVFNLDAGVNNETAGSETVAVGTHYKFGPVLGNILSKNERLIVLPQESQVKLEIELLPWGSAPTLTSQGGTQYAYTTFRGFKIATNHENY